MRPPARFVVEVSRPIGPVAGCSSQLGRHLHHFECLDDVAFLDVIVASETDAAVEALTNLTGVILESAQ